MSAPDPYVVVTIDRVAALDSLARAAERCNALCPPRLEPTEPPKIEPTLKHTLPSAFLRGYNMVLDAGGYMPGKIPVVAVPARLADLKRYARKRSVRSLLRELKLV